MELSLNNEQQMIVDMVRRFVRDEIIPLEMHLDPDADQLEAEDHDRLVGKVKDMGLYGLDIPVDCCKKKISPIDDNIRTSLYGFTW